MTTRSARLPDEALARRASRGDDDAFAALYERYVDDLSDFVTWVVRDRELAADIVTRTFVRVSDRLRLGVQVDIVKAWLFTSARDEALAVCPPLVAETGGLDPLAPIDASRLANAQAVAEERELVWLVCRSAAALSPKDYSLLDLHLRRKLGTRELASALGLDRIEVGVRLSRLQAALELPVTATMLARHGRERCAALDAMLESVGDERPADVRTAIRRHVCGCAVCRGSLRQFVAPAEIFAGLAIVPLSKQCSEAVWERVSLHLAETRRSQAAVDAEQRSSFAAAWSRRRQRALVLSAGAAAVGVVAAVTAFAAVGEGEPTSAPQPAGSADLGFLPPLPSIPSGAAPPRPAPAGPNVAPPPQAPTGRRTFAWAPVAGAESYKLALFREDELVYTVRTTDTSLSLPITWRYQGRAERLGPGSYRWVVWPVMKGSDSPSSKATVAAQLVIH